MVVAIIVPDKPFLEKWAAENQVTGTYQEILVHEKVVKLFEGEIKKQCESAALNKFEYPAKFVLTETTFTQENDLLTPTFKLKRMEAKQYFIKEIKQMYGGAKLQGEEGV